MAYSVSTLLTRARKKFPDADDGATLTLDLANEAHFDICSRVRLYETTEDFTALVAGTAEYAINDETLKIWEAVYYRTAADGDNKELKPIAKRMLEMKRNRWRLLARAEPTYYYVTVNSSGNRMLGLFRTPTTATAAGYPFVRLYVTRRLELVASAPGAGQTATLPNVVDTLDAYLNGIWWRFLATYGRDDRDATAFKKEVYDPSVEQLAARLGLFIADVIPEFHPAIVQWARPR